MLPVDRLVPYIRNARTHSEDQIAQIAASIAEFGFTNPILIGEDEVINMYSGLEVKSATKAFAELMETKKRGRR